MNVLSLWSKNIFEVCRLITKPIWFLSKIYYICYYFLLSIQEESAEFVKYPGFQFSTDLYVLEGFDHDLTTVKKYPCMNLCVYLYVTPNFASPLTQELLRRIGWNIIWSSIWVRTGSDWFLGKIRKEGIQQIDYMFDLCDIYIFSLFAQNLTKYKI